MIKLKQALTGDSNEWDKFIKPPRKIENCL
jgi:hypothetical protein